jgi:hypothetical protein
MILVLIHFYFYFSVLHTNRRAPSNPPVASECTREWVNGGGERLPGPVPLNVALVRLCGHVIASFRSCGQLGQASEW